MTMNIQRYDPEYPASPIINFNKLFVVIYGNRYGYAMILVAFDDETGGTRILDIRESDRPNNFDILEVLKEYFGRGRSKYVIQLRDETCCLLKDKPEAIYINPECGCFNLISNKFIEPKEVSIDIRAGWDLAEGVNSQRITFAGDLSERAIDCLERVSDENDLPLHHLASALLLACSTNTIPLKVWGMADMVE
jgi:hypothetical protein